MQAGSGARIASLLARTSAYPRTEAHLAQRRLSGALLSVSAVVLALCLLATETRDFLRVDTVKRLGVDTERGRPELPVAVSISFPHLPCCVLNLDALDLAGAHDWDGGKGVQKVRLDAQGHDIGVFSSPAGQPDLASIFGGGSAQLLLFTGLLQLVGPEALREMQDALVAHEGCRLQGALSVPRVAGDFQVSVNAHVLYVLKQAYADGAQLNISHTVHTLRFGPEVPGLSSPLNGFVRTIREGESTGVYKFFLKLVPTQYRRLDGKVSSTHQYSVTEYFTPTKTSEGRLPGVFFAYDFSPVTLTIEERRPSLLHFLTRVCAVVGGVFAIFGMFAKLMP